MSDRVPSLDPALPHSGLADGVAVPRRLRRAAMFKTLGPGLITGAADDDPSGIATYSQAGARFGYGMLWTMVLTYPLMSAVQLVSAEIGRVTGQGLARNMCGFFPRTVVVFLVGLLFAANSINIGADLAAMASAGQLVIGGPLVPYTLGFAGLSLVLQIFIPYERYARYLKWLTLVLLSYIAVLFTVRIDWMAAGRGLWPSQLAFSRETTTMVVAIIGTTISPYMFFWQSAQEVEEMQAKPGAQPLTTAANQAPAELRRIKLDTFLGMAVSNLVAIAIILATAATLHSAGKTDIATAADAAEALRPLAGPYAFLLFGLGIIGTGLLAVPVLAGSAAYAIGESQGWPCGLDRKPWEAIGFYIIIALAVLIGVAIAVSGVDPIKALFWSAVINGFVSVPVMAAMMIVASQRHPMGHFVIGWKTRLFGWLAVAVTSAAVVLMLVT